MKFVSSSVNKKNVFQSGFDTKKKKKGTHQTNSEVLQTKRVANKANHTFSVI